MEETAIQLASLLHGLAEQRGGEGTQDAQRQQLQQHQGRQMGGRGQGEAGGGDAQGAGHPFGHQGGEETRDDGGVVHDAHALHLHGKDGGADGGAKEGGEAGGHAGHGDHPLVPVVQVQQLSQLVAHAAADL